MVKESEILWAIANMDRPISTELAELFDASPGGVRHALGQLHDHGFVTRRRRIDPTVGNPPYEYAVADMDMEDRP